jgi:hypothetical protein
VEEDRHLLLTATAITALGLLLVAEEMLVDELAVSHVGRSIGVIFELHLLPFICFPDLAAFL